MTEDSDDDHETVEEVEKKLSEPWGSVERQTLTFDAEKVKSIEEEMSEEPDDVIFPTHDHSFGAGVDVSHDHGIGKAHTIDGSRPPGTHSGSMEVSDILSPLAGFSDTEEIESLDEALTDAAIEAIWGTDSDRPISDYHSVEVAFKCTRCGVRRPTEVRFGDLDPTIRLDCYGPCKGAERHVLDANEWDPVRFEYECPQCDYETILWEAPEDIQAFECPNCDREPQSRGDLPALVPEDWGPPEGPDGTWSVAGRNAFDPIDVCAEFNDIAGISVSKAKQLMKAGYSHTDELRAASQAELAEVSGIGNALAARIKSDVGELDEITMTLVDVALSSDE